MAYSVSRMAHSHPRYAIRHPLSAICHFILNRPNPFDLTLHHIARFQPFGWGATAPTPLGVPVAITSPGSRVIPRESDSMIAGIL